ncbi:alcohol dehydrogenase catalytic domain-containing protein [Streptomyces sp. NBC_01340]|uniref:alcohol dehydrogenase catalytic domain-containing protein n=1 Tax=Streptomyces sp. NBC_01340 TaxID=2903830 RepID=UPI003DA6C8F2
MARSELSVWQNGPADEPAFLGHEPVGEIAAVGPGVTDVTVGPEAVRARKQTARGRSGRCAGTCRAGRTGRMVWAWGLPCREV